MFKGFDEFRINRDDAENGVWAEVPPDGSVRIRIAQWEGPRHLRVLDEITRALQRRYRGRVFHSEESIEVLREVCIRALVTDWEGVIDTENKPVKFSKDNLRKALNDEEYGDELTKWIVMFAKNRANYRKEEMEADIKNLKKSSNGK